jgi:hypothetical protein
VIVNVSEIEIVKVPNIFDESSYSIVGTIETNLKLMMMFDDRMIIKLIFD